MEVLWGYYLKYRTPDIGAYPLEDSRVEYNQNPDYPGLVTYDRILSAKELADYEMVEKPVGDYASHMKCVPADYGDWDKALTLNDIKNMMLDFQIALTQVNDYYFPYVGEPGTRLPSHPDAVTWDCRTELVSGPNVALLLEYVPEWATHMVQYILDGCPPIVFSGLTPEQIIDKCVEIDDDGCYRLFVD